MRSVYLVLHVLYLSALPELLTACQGVADAMQADQIHLIALKVQRKYFIEPNRDSQRWISRHDQLSSDKSLPKQELPATMLSMDYTRVWYTDKYVTLYCYHSARN